FPELLKSAEVIEADVIAGLSAPAQAVDPPVIAARPDRVPVVKRSTPALSRSAERVRRHARYSFRFEIVLQAEQVTVRPHVGAIVSHKNCYVSHNANRTLRAVTTQRMPL